MLTLHEHAAGALRSDLRLTEADQAWAYGRVLTPNCEARMPHRHLSVILAVSVIGTAGSAAASTFTWNPHAVGLGGRKFTADTLVLEDYAQIVFTPVSGVMTFTDVGIMPILGFRLNNQPVAAPDYLKPRGWGAYVSYIAAGVQTFSASGAPQAATFNELHYEIVVNAG